MPKMTDRQREVMERIDRRVPIKVIAGDLKVSEARINQHIRALKDKFEVESMSELVDRYRARLDYQASTKPSAFAGFGMFDDAESDPYRNSLYRNSQLQNPTDSDDQRFRVDPGEIVLSDAHHVLIDAPWIEPREPVVVPSKLDGQHAVLYRIGAMIGIALGIVAAVILVVLAAVTMSEVLAGKASIRLNHDGPPVEKSAGQ